MRPKKDKDKDKRPQAPKLDPWRKMEVTAADAARQQKAAEASQIMGRLGLMTDRQRIFDRWIIRIRRKDTMQILWTKRGMNEDTILTEMLRWLRKEEERTKKQ
ncbi:MAG: hypothetical protein J6X07_08740 [Prevotella sp.]|nr:hypothetical protein [Prevotella sp.]